jgi:hypothetical protein
MTRNIVLALLLVASADALRLVDLTSQRGASSALMPPRGLPPRPSVHMALRGGERAAAPRKPVARPSAAPKMSAIAQAWGGYLDLLDKRPIYTKMATGAVLSAIGDTLAQTLDSSAVAFSVRRLIVLVTVNVLYFSPLLHHWYNFFDMVVAKLKLETGSWACTFTCLALDQIVNTPITLVGFFCVFTLVNAISLVVVGGEVPAMGALVASVGTKLQVEYFNALLANWKVWTLPQVINFAFVPPKLRVAFANVVAVLWNAILSIIANR